MERLRCRIIIFLMAAAWLASALPVVGQERFRAMFYNVENLFDCSHDTMKNDVDWLPESIRHWTPSRYWHKVNVLAEVIACVGENDAPDVVGLCEVENDSVMVALCRRSALRNVGYRYVMTDCDDPRGIDVALLYRPSHFRMLSSEPHAVSVRQIRSDAHARPVFHVCGERLDGDTLDILVCHWPSRIGGRRASEKLRDMAADVCRSVADSLCRIRQHPCILLMGDLNESPSDRAAQSLAKDSLFVNLSSSLPGSYRYRGRWEQIDQMMVSRYLWQKGKGMEKNNNASENSEIATRNSVNLLKMQLYDAPWLQEKEPVWGGLRPRRTYNGMKYQGGVSDHLPVYVDIP